MVNYMNIILLSGGSGKRLWPLSNDVRSKQFIKLFKDEHGKYESMVQRMYKNILKVDKNAVITIATSKTQVSAINNQIGNEVGISLEPCRRDTFPAIALAVSYLYDVKNVSIDEPVVVCPVDPYVESDYFTSLVKLYELAKTSEANLSLMGITPTYPSEKYGYIIPENNSNVSKVKMFKEKPDVDTAEMYIAQGALWNGGIFAFKLKYVLDIAHKLINFTDYYDLSNKYETLEKISFDYAVVEKESKIQVMRFNGEWKDLGTWNTLTDTLDDNIYGNGMLDESSSNTHIINELSIPILGMGLNNVVVAASPDGILVSRKDKTSQIKPYVEKIHQRIMFSEKSWGTYKVIDVQDGSLTNMLTMKAGKRMQYHSHDSRDEVWTIISGTGVTVIDGVSKSVKSGDVITIKSGCKHTIIAETELKIIEVQLGKEISVNDKHKYTFKE